MIKNYLKIAFRNLIKQKLHSLINIAGLTIGMTISILILSYVRFELSFDRFHSKFDQIYIVVQTRSGIDKVDNWKLSGPGVASVLKEEFPEVIQSARLNYIRQEVELSYNDKEFIEEPGSLVLTDPEMFDIFDINLTRGDPETALQDPYSIILTEEESRKYFGNENPIGKFINIHEAGEEEDEGMNLKVTGVAKAMPVNSHFSFKFLIPHEKDYSGSYSFFSLGECTYITLPSDYQPENLEKKFPQIVRKYIAPVIEDRYSVTYDDWLESGGVWKLGLLPLKAIHLDNYYRLGGFLKSNKGPINRGNLLHVRIYTVIALLIIALACINFIILSTARSRARAKEVGVRKVNGATRVQLIRQFLTESILLSVIALVFAVILVLVFSKPFHNLLEIQTSYNLAGIVFIGTSLLVVTLVTGLIAGSYPAFFLSAFRPVNVLKGQLLEKMKGMAIRNGLVVFQFMISMILIISSITVYKQYIYIQNKDLGFDKENIIIINNLYRNLWRQDSDSLSINEREIRAATLLQEVLKHPNVINASLMGSPPGKWVNDIGIRDVRTEGATAEKKYSVFTTRIDHVYLDVFGLEMAAGQNFRKVLTIPQTREGIIINEKAADYIGLKDPVGKHIYADDWEYITNNEGEGEWVKKEVKIPVIGVFKDFHNRNLREDIRPTMFYPLYTGNYTTNYLAVRFLPGNIPDNIALLEKTWNKMGVSKPLEYSFFDKEIEDLYIKEKKLTQVFTFFTLLAIFIACLGIYGLATFTAEQRTKEIGIRKVMGASVRKIVTILSRIYLKLLIVATLIACPAGYIIMDKWLQGFVFQIDIGAGIFIFSVLITTIIVFSSVSYQSVKAALTNPANTLKYE